MKLRPLHDGILFCFEEEVDRNRSGAFVERSDAGIMTFASVDATTKQGRWGVVLSVGSSVKDDSIVPGARICIEPLQWTTGSEFEGQTYWKTDEDKVLAVDAAG